MDKTLFPLQNTFQSTLTGTYNGKEGNLDIKTNNNGDKKGIHVEFTNEDINNLFTMPPSSKTIHQQLMEDFDINQPKLGQLMIRQMREEEMPDSFPIIISPSINKMMRSNNNNTMIKRRKTGSKGSKGLKGKGVKRKTIKRTKNRKPTSK
jgi:hypothetical protein